MLKTKVAVLTGAEISHQRQLFKCQ